MEASTAKLLLVVAGLLLKFSLELIVPSGNGCSITPVEGLDVNELFSFSALLELKDL